MQKERDEGGAVVLLVTVLTVVVVAVASLAIDIGMQRVSRRDMQALADVVALDMARYLDGRSVATISADPNWQAALDKSVARNDETFGDPTVSYELGTVDAVTGAFIVKTGSYIPDAVRITAQTDIDYAINAGTGHAIRKAVGQAVSAACFKLGSYAANIDTTKATLLNSVLGRTITSAALNVTLVGYQGLATANVDLLELASKLNVGTVDELVDTSVSLGTLLQATANVLSDHNDTVNAAILNSIRTSITNTTLVDVNIGDLLDVTKGYGSALSGSFKVLDLLVGSVFVADHQHLITVPSVAINSGFLGNAAMGLTVIEAAKYACGAVGKATANTSQVNTSLDATLVGLPSILGLTSSGTLHMDLQFANADGVLKAINCATSGSPDEGVTVGVTSHLTSAQISIPITLVGALGLKVSVSVTLNTTKSASAQDITVTVQPPYTSYNSAVSTGSGTLGLSASAATVTAQVVSGVLSVGLSLTSIQNAVRTSIVTPLLSTIDNTVLPMLQHLFGITVAGADVFAVPRPSCSTPALVG